MDEAFEMGKVDLSDVKETLSETLDRLSKAARPEAVFAKPQTIGERTLITTSEVFLGLGMGMGVGYGSGGQAESEAEAEEPAAEGTPEKGFGGGGGGGGGGGANARPVAVIVVEPDEVRVEPIVDVTKIGIAAATAWAAVFIQVLRLLRAGRSTS